MSTGGASVSGRLAAYGGAPKGDAAAEAEARPSEFNDTTSANEPAPLHQRRAEDQPETDLDASPPVFADNARKAIAAKARAARTAGNPTGNTDPVDKFNIPAGMHVEGDDEDARLAEQEQRESDDVRQDERRAPAPRAPARTEPAAETDKKYNLRVNRNDIAVSRDELIRYAEVTEDEARDMPESALIRLAQKQIGASAYLDDARAQHKSARTAGAEPANPSDQLQPETERSPTTQPTGLSAKSDKELVELIQFGTPEEASEALNVRTARSMQAMESHRRAEEFDRGVQGAIADFAGKHPEIADDDDLADMHRGVLLREMSKEIAAKVPGLPGHITARIATDQNVATQVYRAAVADGFNLRSPAQMFEDSAHVVRKRVGLEEREPDPKPDIRNGGERRHEPPASQSREDLKRGLFRQPSRSDSVSQQPAPQAQGARKSPSATIRERYGNRMSRG